MQHFENNKTSQQLRVVDMHNRMEKVYQACQQENFQRSDYVNDSLLKLQERIKKDSIVQTSKNKLMVEQLSNLQNDVQKIHQITQQNVLKQQNARQLLQEDNKIQIQNYYEKSNENLEDIQHYANKKLADISNILQDRNKRVVENTDEKMKQLRYQIQDVRTSFINQKNELNISLKQMNQSVNNQTDKIMNFIEQLRYNRQQNERATDMMLTELEDVLSKLVVEQMKAGQTTYDCLMKLFEDTCSKLQQNLLK